MEEEINYGTQLSSSKSFFVNNNLSAMPSIMSSTNQVL